MIRCCFCDSVARPSKGGRSNQRGRGGGRGGRSSCELALEKKKNSNMKIKSRNEEAGVERQVRGGRAKVVGSSCFLVVFVFRSVFSRFSSSGGVAVVAEEEEEGEDERWAGQWAGQWWLVTGVGPFRCISDQSPTPESPPKRLGSLAPPPFPRPQPLLFFPTVAPPSYPSHCRCLAVPTYLAFLRGLA